MNSIKEQEIRETVRIILDELSKHSIHIKGIRIHSENKPGLEISSNSNEAGLLIRGKVYGISIQGNATGRDAPLSTMSKKIDDIEDRLSQKGI